MRKNLTHECAVPNSRNDLIDMINERKSVIVIKNELVSDVHTDLNQDKKKAEKSGNTLKTAGVLAGLWAVFCSTHPIGWIIGGVTAITAGTIRNLKKVMNHYETYSGKDSSDKDIYIMLYDDVSLKYDTINYPQFVKGVNTKKPIKKIKL